MYVLHWKKRMIMGQQIIVDWNHMTMFNNKYYYPLKIDDNVIDLDNRIGDKHIGVLFLPRIAQIRDDTVPTYCYISSDWRSR